MATAAASAGKLKVKELSFLWEGKDRHGKVVKGEMRAGGDHEAVVGELPSGDRNRAAIGVVAFGSALGLALGPWIVGDLRREFADGPGC